MRWNAACPAVVVELLDTQAGVEWEVLHHVAWQANFEAKVSDESHNGIGSCWGVVVGGRRVRGSRWSARRYNERGSYSL